MMDAKESQHEEFSWAVFLESISKIDRAETEKQLEREWGAIFETCDGGNPVVPAYLNTTSPNSLDAGDAANVWSASDGNLVSGTKTARVALVQRADGGATKLSFRVAFGGAPGAISLQLQTADFDTDADYSNEGSPVTALNTGTNEARGETTLVSARFARILAGTVTNAVTASVDITA